MGAGAGDAVELAEAFDDACRKSADLVVGFGDEDEEEDREDDDEDEDDPAWESPFAVQREDIPSGWLDSQVYGLCLAPPCARTAGGVAWRELC